MAVFRPIVEDDTVLAPLKTLHPRYSMSERSRFSRKSWKASEKQNSHAEIVLMERGFQRPELRRKQLKLATCARLRALYRR